MRIFFFFGFFLAPAWFPFFFPRVCLYPASPRGVGFFLVRTKKLVVVVDIRSSFCTFLQEQLTYSLVFLDFKCRDLNLFMRVCVEVFFEFSLTSFITKTHTNFLCRHQKLVAPVISSLACF